MLGGTMGFEGKGLAYWEIAGISEGAVWFRVYGVLPEVALMLYHKRKLV